MFLWCVGEHRLYGAGLLPPLCTCSTQKKQKIVPIIRETINTTRPRNRCFLRFKSNVIFYACREEIRERTEFSGLQSRSKSEKVNKASCFTFRPDTVDDLCNNFRIFISLFSTTVWNFKNGFSMRWAEFCSP